MKTIVTGGAGFIGSHLVERLLQNSHDVMVLDNFSTGRMENLAHLAESAHLTIDEVDVSQHAEILPHFEGVQWVFHLAALADIVPSIMDPLKYHHANVDGTVSILEAARQAEVKRFVYAASSSCYGLPDRFPTPEDSAIKPMYPYALSKRLGEECVLHWSQLYGLPAVSLRLFNVYGPKSRTIGTYGAVFGVFLAQKLAGEPLTVVGDGNQTRDFTFVTDVVDAMIKAAESDAIGECFNVGSGNTYSINHLVSLLGAEKVGIPKRPGEPDCTFADIEKIQRRLNWKPNVSFEEGVKIMLDNICLWNEAPLWNSATIATATQDWFRYLDNQIESTPGAGNEQP